VEKIGADGEAGDERDQEWFKLQREVHFKLTPDWV
jgi:hypothetical protein